MPKARFLLGNVEEIIACTLMVVMCLTTFANVIGRYFLGSPIEWAEEVARYSFAWMVFLGAVICTKRGKHILIDAVLVAVPERVRTLFLVIGEIVIICLMGLLAYFGWFQALSANQPMATLKLPGTVQYMGLPVAAALIALYSLLDLRRQLARLSRGDR